MSVSEARALDASLLKRRLLSGGAWAVGGKAGAVVLGLSSNMLLARLLTPGEFGAYLLIVSVVSAGGLIGCLGLNNATTRFVAEGLGLNQPGRTKRVIRAVVVLGVFGALGSGFAYLLVNGLLERVFNAPALAAIAGLIAGWIVISTLQELFAETFRGFHDIRLATLFGGLTIGNSAGLVTRVLFLACLISLWFFRGGTDLRTILLIVLAAGSIGALMSGYVLFLKTGALIKDSAEKQANVELGEILAVSLPLLVTNLTAFALIYSDIWILAAFRPQEEVAVYGAAARFMTLVTMPLMIVNAVLPPMIADLYARGEKNRLEQIMRPIATLTGIPALLALGIFVVAGAPILGLVYGDFYRNGALILALLSLGKLAAVWAGSCGLTLQMTGHQTLMMWISVFSGLLFVGGALYAVQEFGAVGVASVAAASVAFQNLLTVLVVRIKTGIWTHAAFSVTLIRKLLAMSRSGDKQ